MTDHQTEQPKPDRSEDEQREADRAFARELFTDRTDNQ